MDNKQITYHYQRGIYQVRFRAMASPCELLVETDDRILAQILGEKAAKEAWRIEEKFSRYRDDSVLAQIHAREGKVIVVDEETSRLLDFASTCYEISDGLFDITSGVLGEIWRFNEEMSLPSDSTISEYMNRIGWEKISWQAPNLILPKGMKIDFGGIGKEYAVDQIAHHLSQETELSFLINLGGDLFANQPPNQGQAWYAGIENPDNVQAAIQHLKLKRGALATSGDVRQHRYHQGKRYGHILNPKTGWPVEDPPRSVTVAAATCTQAGLLSTLAMLHGPDAETFLDAQEVKYWCLR